MHGPAGGSKELADPGQAVSRAARLRQAGGGRARTLSRFGRGSILSARTHGRDIREGGSNVRGRLISVWRSSARYRRRSFAVGPAITACAPQAYSIRMRRLIALALVLAACTSTTSTPPTPPASTPSAASTGSAGPSATTARPSAAATDRPARQLGAIQMLDERIGWIATATGLYRTADAGASWTNLGAPSSAPIRDLRFIDARRGWAVLRDQPQIGCMQASNAAPCRSVVATTDDGGASWSERLSVPLPPTLGPDAIRGLQAVDAQRAWVTVLSGTCDPNGCPYELRATIDGGATWRVQHVADGSSLMRFASARRGWLSVAKSPQNGSRIFVTSDGGGSWTASLDTDLSVVGIDAASEDEAWALLLDGRYCTASSCSRYDLRHTVDGGTTWQTLGNIKDQATCSGGHLRAPLFASPRLGWLPLSLGGGGANVGPGGLMRTTDGGRTWDCRNVPASAGLVSAADPLNAWATSVSRETAIDRLYATRDGGTTWSEVALTGVR